MKGQLRLNEIIISITNRCNLRCAMCRIPSRPAVSEMSTEEVKALISDAAVFFPSAIVFSGGEPLLRKDLFELAAFARQKRLNTCLTSNGMLIDDATAGRLAKSGMGVVNISIEGPEKVHDDLRGAGSYKAAVEALGHLARHNIETTIATTVCRQNFRFLPDVMKLALATGTTTVKFQPFSPIFLLDKAKGEDFFIAPEFHKEFGEVVEAVIGWARAHRIATNPPAYLRSLPSYLCGRGVVTPPARCAALWTSCPISAGGDVHPCWIFSDKVVGNVKKERFSRIWNSSAHDRLRQDIFEKECRGCFMSCYDANLGKPAWAESIVLKAGKLARPKFYQRTYFRSYQYARYLFEKAIRRISRLGRAEKRKDPLGSAADLEAIRSAKNVLRKKLDSLT